MHSVSCLERTCYQRPLADLRGNIKGFSEIGSGCILSRPKPSSGVILPPCSCNAYNIARPEKTRRHFDRLDRISRSGVCTYAQTPCGHSDLQPFIFPVGRLQQQVDPSLLRIMLLRPHALSNSLVRDQLYLRELMTHQVSHRQGITLYSSAPIKIPQSADRNG